MSGLDFTVKYVPDENVLPGALSGLYKFGALGTVRASVEYIEHDPLRTDTPGDIPLFDLILVGQEVMATVPRRSNCLANEPAVSSEESTRRQPTPFARKPATDLPPVPVTLPEGSASSPKRHGRPPKIAPPCDDVAGPRASCAVG